MAFFVRKNERREIRRAVTLACHVVRLRDSSLISSHTMDLSPDGMFVASDTELDPGESVFVTFRATDLGLSFSTEAKVARIIRGRRQGDRQRGIGLRFSTLGPVKRLILRAHLRRVPPPVPRRKQRIDWAATIRSIGR